MARSIEPGGRAVLLFSALLLLLGLEGDGHFPLPAATPEPLFQLYVLGLTLAFGAGLVLLLRSPRPASVDRSAGAAPRRLQLLRLAAATAVLFALLDGALLWLETRHYAWFPLTAARSDRLPLLVAAGRELLAGRDPYTLDHLAGGPVTLSHLPGMVAAYLPAALFGLDPRLLGLVYTLGAALLLHRLARPAAAAWLALFLLSPYLVYRHDFELGPCFLLLALTWVLLGRRRPVPLALCSAALILTSQVLAIPAAAVAVFVWRRDGRRAGLRLLAAVAAIAGAVFLCFLLPDPASFARGVFAHWTAPRSLQSLGLAYWLTALLPLPVLRALQAAAVAFVLIRVPRSSGGERPDPFEDTLAGLPGALPPAPPGLWICPRRRRSVFVTAALALALFAALDTVVSTDLYLLVLYLAMLAQLPARSPEPAAVAGGGMP